MADNTNQLADQAQEFGRAMSEAMQGMAEMQFNSLQRFAEIQRTQMTQAVEMMSSQMQLIGTTKDPGEFASAQADLVNKYGQKYADSMQEAVKVASQAWQEYARRLTNTAASNRPARKK